MPHVVVIPVYKTDLDQFELISLKACCIVLGAKHDICLVTHASLCLAAYTKIAEECGIQLKMEFFEPAYFKNIHGYNKLLLSSGFYTHFSEYDYMLVCQLDSYVFRDELDDWCSKGYDYIGAPLFPHSPCKDENLIGVMVGNGGFSLRRIDAFIRILNRKLSFGELFKLKIKRNNYVIFRKKFLYLLMLFLHKRCNTIRDLLTYFVMEDRFFSCTLKDTPLKLKTPNPQLAMYFAFDLQPCFLYEQTEQLPFGCHAWMKGRNLDFYNRFIKL